MYLYIMEIMYKEVYMHIFLTRIAYMQVYLCTEWYNNCTLIIIN